jgi:hypothetical protein
VSIACSGARLFVRELGGAVEAMLVQLQCSTCLASTHLTIDYYTFAHGKVHPVYAQEASFPSCLKRESHSQAFLRAPCDVAKSCSLSCNTPCHAFGQVLAACTHLLVSAVRSWNPAPAPARPLFVIHRALSPGVSPSTAPKATCGQSHD